MRSPASPAQSLDANFSTRVRKAPASSLSKPAHSATPLWDQRTRSLFNWQGSSSRADDSISMNGSKPRANRVYTSLQRHKLLLGGEREATQYNLYLTFMFIVF